MPRNVWNTLRVENCNPSAVKLKCDGSWSSSSNSFQSDLTGLSSVHHIGANYNARQAGSGLLRVLQLICSILAVTDSSLTGQCLSVCLFVWLPICLSDPQPSDDNMWANSVVHGSRSTMTTYAQVKDYRWMRSIYGTVPHRITYD